VAFNRAGSENDEAISLFFYFEIATTEHLNFKCLELNSPLSKI